MKKSLVVIIGIIFLGTAAYFSYGFFKKDDDKQAIALDKIKLPDGFKISVFAKVSNARSMVVSDNGTVFVGNRAEDKVYAVQDTDGDFVADKVYIIDKGLEMPNGVALKDGDLYVAEVSRILKYENIENNLASPPEPIVVYDQYPTERHHGWKYIAFGPDGYLYVPVGAPCNICLNADKPIFASITKIDVSNPTPQVIANGVRNTVGFDWNPVDGKLWFTDNGRDMMGNDIPPCELNVVNNDGEHFGYPFCHGGTILDPEFGDGKNCVDYIAPAVNFGAHVAPLGMTFYDGQDFPSSYANNIFVAQHGSWNRDKKSGYQVMVIEHDNSQATSVKVFAEGWLDHETQIAWGRPVDVVTLADGSLLVSDDYADVIYRISYEG